MGGFRVFRGLGFREVTELLVSPNLKTLNPKPGNDHEDEGDSDDCGVVMVLKRRRCFRPHDFRALGFGFMVSTAVLRGSTLIFIITYAFSKPKGLLRMAWFLWRVWARLVDQGGFCTCRHLGSTFWSQNPCAERFAIGR